MRTLDDLPRKNNRLTPTGSAVGLVAYSFFNLSKYLKMHKISSQYNVQKQIKV